VSHASPIGQALLGKRAGDDVVVKTPGGEMRYRVVELV
jgi:transcription elongation factor GreA